MTDGSAPLTRPTPIPTLWPTRPIWNPAEASADVRPRRLRPGTQAQPRERGRRREDQMSKRHRLPRRHHRAWYFLWIFCACGYRWPCPRVRALAARPVPAPRPVPPPEPCPAPSVTPPRPRPPAHSTRPPAPTPRRPVNDQRAVRRATNNHPLWNSPSGQHEIGRAGRFTPAQAYRARVGSVPTTRS